MWYLESEQVPPISEPIHILNTSRQLSRFPQKWEPNPPLTREFTVPRCTLTLRYHSQQGKCYIVFVQNEVLILFGDTFYTPNLTTRRIHQAGDHFSDKFSLSNLNDKLFVLKN